MKVAIMQPYFMPYLGYFSLIKHVDQFILFDTAQHIRHGWIERNRILKLDNEPMYIKVPLVKHNRETLIKDIRINNNLQWKQKIYAQLLHYKKRAPYYNVVIALVEDIFQEDFDAITRLNFVILNKISKHLGIFTPIKILSEMNLVIDEATKPDEWALNICKAIGAKDYYNAIGGKSFFDTQKYSDSLINLKFLELIPKPYKQFNNQFIPFLSILDVLMFCNKEQIIDLLNEVEILE
jgi:hypothetical protein